MDDTRFTLSLDNLNRAAQSLGCSLPALQAVVEVESAGRGFLSDGRVKALFEGHIFYRYTKGRFAQSHPILCYPKWTKKYYATGKNADERGGKELQRLYQAMSLDRTAALMSASYGMFQLMGFNFAIFGYTSVDPFYDAMRHSAMAQLEAFVEYIEHTGLADELRDRRWADFAKRYNGPAFAKNAYDTKLAAAYARHVVKRGAPG